MRDSLNEPREDFFRLLFVSLQENIAELKVEIDQFQPNLDDSGLYLEYLSQLELA